MSFAGPDVIRAELEAAGLVQSAEETVLPHPYFLVFQVGELPRLVRT